MRWLIADSLSCREQFFCSHLDSIGHFLAEAGEETSRLCLNDLEMFRGDQWAFPPDVVFALDQYDRCAEIPGRIHIAQVAAVTIPLPWNVRKADGSPAYDLILSSIPAMVEQARAAGCRAEFQSLAFDHRALAAAMMVRERDIPCLFVGTRDGNHRKREEVLTALGDLVTCAPPTFGRAYYQLVARAKVLVHVQAEWGEGCRNALRYYEGSGLGAVVVGDGPMSRDYRERIGLRAESPQEFRDRVQYALCDADGVARKSQGRVLQWHGYHNRIPQLVKWARELAA